MLVDLNLMDKVVYQSKEAVNSIRKIKTQVTQQQENLIELFNLIKKNPNLPIIPMVDNDVVGDEFSNTYWKGYWGHCDIDKYIEDDKGIIFYEHGEPDISDIFYRFFDCTECGITTDMSDEEAWKIMRKKADSLDWKEAIFVYITTE